jgi:hypothetical protein
MASPSPSQGDSPSTPSKRPASTAEHELSPMQKRLNTSQGTPTPSPRSAASQARLDAMLRAQGLPAESEASTNALLSTAVPHSSASPSSASSYHTALPGTSTSPLLPSWCPVPSSALLRPVTPPPTADRTERHWPPQTPSPARVPVAQSEYVNRTGNENSNIPRNGMRNSVLDPSTVSDGAANLYLSPICRA